jgi:hypothetical protein
MSVTVTVVITFFSTAGGLGIIFGVAKLGVAVYPLWRDYRNKRYLDEKLSRGPYDKATIERSTHYYIRPKCTNIDPAQELELRHALVATREDLFTKIDEFLDHDNSHRHLLILADSGTGKTSFLLNYYVHNAHKRKRKPHKLAIVPLGQKDADTLITKVPDQEETAILLDALDEDIQAHTDHAGRVKELMDKCAKFKRVIMTCRTQFFPKDEEIPVTTGIVRLGPLRAGEKSIYEFWKLYLAPFDDSDIDQYVKKRYPFWSYRQRRKAHAMIKTIPLLSVRPMLLAHIPDLIDSDVKINSCYQLYKLMVDAWLGREIAWADKDALKRFSELLAVDMYMNRESREMERIPRDQLVNLAAKWHIELHDWQISSRSLLNRDAQGNYKFAHRSIMEFLFTKELVRGNENCVGALLTDQMKRFLIEMLIETEPLLLLDRITNLLIGFELRVQYYRGPKKESTPIWLKSGYESILATIIMRNAEVFNKYKLDYIIKKYNKGMLSDMEIGDELLIRYVDEAGQPHAVKIDSLPLRELQLLLPRESEEQFGPTSNSDRAPMPLEIMVTALNDLTPEELHSLDSSGNLENFVSFIHQHGLRVWWRISAFNDLMGSTLIANPSHVGIRPVYGNPIQAVLKFTPQNTSSTKQDSL